MDSIDKMHSNKARVLFALFDDSSIRQIIRQFDGHGCECVVATRSNGSPFQFIEPLDRFDGIIVNLTGLSEEGEQVVANWAQKHPVAGWMATDDTNISRVVRALKMGAFDVLQGDLRPLEVKSLVDELTSRRSSAPRFSSTPELPEGGAGYSAPTNGSFTGESSPILDNAAQTSMRRNGDSHPHRRHSTSCDKKGNTESLSHWLRMYLRGSSTTMESVRRQVLEVATTHATVMIWGQSGTGKEMVARAIHRCSLRKETDYIPVNMSAIPEGLAESLLFGHIKGSFTHATHTKEGLCETADNGTLFLDEISEMEITLQPKLLRFLQEGTVRRVGDQTEKQVDVRIIAASNHDPESVIRDGKLRSDLFYRLNVVPIHLPPLSERREDIAELSELFLSRSVERHNRSVQGFTAEAMQVLYDYDWPGNIRQLENAVERIAIFAKGKLVEPLDIPAEFHSPSCTAPSPHVPSAPTNGHMASSNGGTIEHKPQENDSSVSVMRTPLSEVQRFERAAIIDALQRADGHVVDAANLVGLGQATLYRKIKRYDIPHKSHRRRKTPK